MATRVLLINGPNLNLLGTREPQIYGSTTLADVISTAESQSKSLGVTLESFQSNHEGAIVDRIQEAAGFGPNGDRNKDGKVSAIIINPGAYTHTSVAYVGPFSFDLLFYLFIYHFLRNSLFCSCPPPPPFKSPFHCQETSPECLDSALPSTHMTDVHTSIRDALLGVEIPFVEVHVSNVHAREAWRKHSYFSDKATAVIAGLGVYGYQAALEFVAKHLKR